MYFFDGRIRYSEADITGRLTLAALLNYFQDCSTFQSEDLGVGVAYLAERHMVWVLSSWQIVVERYPLVGEHVQIGTQPYEFKGFLGSRNFVMIAEDGSYCAKANSLWCLLNTDTGKPVMPTEKMREKYVVADRVEMEYAPRKIALPAGGEDREPITVKKHHLDTNHHVNNGQYVDMAMEFLPESFAIRQLRAEYKEQTFLDDVLCPRVAREGNRFTVALNDGAGRPHAIVEFTE
ncbi:MAG: thioesterase [Muribaculum sp.]|nr:thioesterase [Muribaculum sp.]